MLQSCGNPDLEFMLRVNQLMLDFVKDKNKNECVFCSSLSLSLSLSLLFLPPLSLTHSLYQCYLVYLLYSYITSDCSSLPWVGKREQRSVHVEVDTYRNSSKNLLHQVWGSVKMNFWSYARLNTLAIILLRMKLEGKLCVMCIPT